MSSNWQTAEEKQQQKSPLKRLVDVFYGYDFFISYSRRGNPGGFGYAEQLTRRLEASGFECFFDSDDYAMGDSWKRVGARKLRVSSRLLLVGTPEALESPAVLRELEIYSKKDDARIIPIDFGGSIKNRDPAKPAFQHIADDILFIEESPENLEHGPSTQVIERLVAGFDLARQDNKRARAYRIVATVLALLTIGAAVLAWIAKDQADEASKQAILATQNAKETGEALARSDLLRAAELSEQDQNSRALAFLARGARTNPQYSVIGTKLLLTLTDRDWYVRVEKVPSELKFAPHHEKIALPGNQDANCSSAMGHSVDNAILQEMGYEFREDELIEALAISGDQTVLAELFTRSPSYTGLRFWTRNQGPTSRFQDLTVDIPRTPDTSLRQPSLKFNHSGDRLVLSLVDWTEDFELTRLFLLDISSDLGGFHPKIVFSDSYDDLGTPSVVVTPNDNLFLLVSGEEISLWDLRSGERQGTLDDPGLAFGKTTFAANGDWLEIRGESHGEPSRYTYRLFRCIPDNRTSGVQSWRKGITKDIYDFVKWVNVDQEIKSRMPNSTKALATHPRNSNLHILADNNNRSVMLWDDREPTVLRRSLTKTKNSRHRAWFLPPTGNYAIVETTRNEGSGPAYLELFDVASGVKLRSRKLKSSFGNPIFSPSGFQEGTVTGISPEGDRLYVSHPKDQIYTFEIPYDPEEIPLWIADLAEAVGGFRLNKSGAIEAVPPSEREKTLEALRKDVENRPPTNRWELYAQWLLKDPDSRPPSPFSN